MNCQKLVGGKPVVLAETQSGAPTEALRYHPQSLCGEEDPVFPGLLEPWVCP